MKRAKEASAKYTEKSFKAFLDCESGCNEKWVVGIAKASEPEDIEKSMEFLSYHSNKERLDFLRKSFPLSR